VYFVTKVDKSLLRFRAPLHCKIMETTLEKFGHADFKLSLKRSFNSGFEICQRTIRLFGWFCECER
jgi:hypothetical protein